MEKLSFDKLPEAVAILHESIEELKRLLVKNSNTELLPKSSPISIKEVAKLTGLTVPTLYGYCQRNEIPYSKKGNRLFFFEEEIINWIKTGKRKTISEIHTEAENYISKK